MSHKFLLDTGVLVGRLVRKSTWGGGVLSSRRYLKKNTTPLCGGQIFGVSSRNPMGISPAYGQTPNIWPHSSLDIDTALRKEPRPPEPPLSSTLLMSKDQRQWQGAQSATKVSYFNLTSGRTKRRRAEESLYFSSIFCQCPYFPLSS